MDWNDTEAVDDIATPAAHNLLWRLEGAEILASTANDPISSPMGRPGLAVSQTQNLVSGKVNRDILVTWLAVHSYANCL